MNNYQSCIQLDLFTGAVIAPVIAELEEPEHEPVEVLNPCLGCELREFCSDDCAKHLTPLDVPFNPTTRFRSLRQYINTLKANGWA